MCMRNWTIDTSQFNIHSSEYKIWKLEQLVNYGLHGEKIPASWYKKYHEKLTLDPHKKKYLTFLLEHA